MVAELENNEHAFDINAPGKKLKTLLRGICTKKE